jgi:cell division protein FtsA
MAQRNIAVGIDVGTTKIAASVGQVQENGIDIIGVGFAPSNGLSKGVVVDIEETVSSISACLEEAERMSGLPITEAVVNIGGNHIQTAPSRGVIAVSRPDGEVAENDVLRVLDAARSVSVPTNREILHAIPRWYSVDGQPGIKDPLGMTGIRLEVETQVISGATGSIKNLNKCMAQAGVNVTDFVFTPLAAARALLNKRQKDLGVAVVDIGGGTTSFAIYEEGYILHAGVLPVGATHITNDIAIGLRTSIDTAEIIKIKYGTGLPEQVDEEKMLNLSKIDKKFDEEVSLKLVAEIIEARLIEILNMIQDELRRVGKNGMLPAGVVLTGGGAKLDGITEVAKHILQLPVEVGEITHNISGMVDNIADPLYASSVGLMLWGLEANNSSPKKGSGIKIPGSIGKARSFFKRFFL